MPVEDRPQPSLKSCNAGPLPATVQAALEAERLAGEEPTKVFMMELCICQGAKSRVRRGDAAHAHTVAGARLCN